MAEVATLTTASGWHHEVFGKVSDARPDCIRLLDFLKFEEKNKLGKQLSEAIWLSEESGFTYDLTGAGGDMEESVVAESQELVGTSGIIALRSQTAYRTFAAAVAEGKQAFGSFYKQKIANMRRSHMKRLEVNAFHGSRSLGTVESVVDGGAGVMDIVITAETWAPWIWAGSKGTKLDAYLVSGPTQRNPTAAIVVASVDMGARTLSVTGTESELDATVAGDELFYLGSYDNESPGLISAVSNTGEYLGIDGADYELWTGNTFDAENGNLTWDVVNGAVEEAASKGLDEDLVFFCSLPSWGSLNADVNALRKLDSSYSKEKTDIGSQKLVYHTHTGMVEVHCSGICKGGEAFGFPKSEVARFGVNDFTFELPGIETGTKNFFRFVQGQTRVEMQSYSDASVICRAPSKGFLIENIVNG